MREFLDLNESLYFHRFLPLLKFMEEMGVGAEVVYGLGRYKVEVRE